MNSASPSSPLASGFLSGKYTRDKLSDPDNRYSGFDIIPFDKEQGFKLVERMRAIAGAHNASIAQLAIAWLLSRDAVTSVLIGATKQHQLQDNLAAADLTLTGSDIAELDAATVFPPVYPNWFIDNFVDQPIKQALARTAV